MIVIAVYWLFLFILLLPLGVLTQHALKLKTNSPILTLLSGIVLLTCGFTFTAFFMPLGAFSLAIWCIISLASGIYFKSEVFRLIKSFGESLKQLPSYLKIVIGILTFAALLKSAQYPFIIDNESYYVQTIKWLNEFGFVKGLGNLHMFFAQNSGWHVLQAGLNFSFVSYIINDINGFVFLICTFYCIIEGQRLSTDRRLHWLMFMPLPAILFFQFLDVPSPDLPLLIITSIILHLYAQHSENEDNYKIALLFFILLVFIKLTVLPLGILFLPGLLKRQNLVFITVTAIPIAILWISKNIIVNGYPLYPIAYFKTGYDWAMPDNLFHFIIDNTADYGYNRTTGNALLPPDTSMTDKLLMWLQQNGLARIVNRLTIAVLALMPVAIAKNKKYMLIYIALLINFLVVLFTSPQFRYFLYITICAGLFVVAWLFNILKTNALVYKGLLALSILLISITFFNLKFSGLTANKHHQSNSVVRWQQLYKPEGVTKLPKLEFIQIKMDNLEYYSPKYNFFRYGTANGPLPCVNSEQIEYLYRELGIIPQLRSTELKDGFKSVKK
ncbi:hypothetical protein FMM05_06215 [Flavobacterium zepuense]|uniref:DUF8201 domain-containing protein n=1 Tax=Flavobacterium zepuense TaxID=2593302 RepID=A0A552V5Q9_9FLAO|nr:hypothetical protein [Flavobacterium zepuense]TRW25814.1 hypothetical protein FMM05_06215 [Flavobacterium zepuense]